MTTEQECAIDRLSLIGGGFATAHPPHPLRGRLIEAEIPPKARRFTVNEDGSVVDMATGELHRYLRDLHEFEPPITSDVRTRVRPKR